MKVGTARIKVRQGLPRARGNARLRDGDGCVKNNDEVGKCSKRGEFVGVCLILTKRDRVTHRLVLIGECRADIAVADDVHPCYEVRHNALADMVTTCLDEELEEGSAASVPHFVAQNLRTYLVRSRRTARLMGEVEPRVREESRQALLKKGHLRRLPHPFTALGRDEHRFRSGNGCMLARLA